MEKTTDSYEQPVKAEIRRRILTHAVESLTIHRDESRVVRVDELKETTELAKRLLASTRHVVDSGKLDVQLENWITYSNNCVGRKTAAELKVLYLTGPRPLNDLDVLTSLGVNPHNVWAVTSTKKHAEAAAQQIADSGSALKIHHGPIGHFFRAHTDTFDIVYLDCCGPFAYGKPNTLEPVLELLSQNRLAPLSVLITNFSQATNENQPKYDDLLTSYFRYRYRSARPEFHEEVCFEEAKHDPTRLKRLVESSWEGTSLPYSEFVTMFIADLAMVLIPQCRSFSLPAFIERYLASDKKLRTNTLSKATHEPKGPVSLDEWHQAVGDAVVAPDSYPLYSFINTLKKIDGDKLANQLLNSTVNGKKIAELIEFATFSDRVIEGHWDLLSRDFQKAILLSWFDSKIPFTCDAPMPNLVVNALIGVYGAPAFVNTRRSQRLRYTAKTNEMFCDLFIFDQCRYFFDWLPTLETFESRFSSIEFQILARCIMDRIGRHNWSSDVHTLRGAAVGSYEEVPSAGFFNFCERETVVVSAKDKK